MLFWHSHHAAPFSISFGFLFCSLKQYKSIKIQAAFHIRFGFVSAVELSAPRAGVEQSVSCPCRGGREDSEMETHQQCFLLSFSSPYPLFGSLT